MEEDERVESTLAATPALQPNFKSVSVTKDQLNKFKELHRRRLQIKEQTKKKIKGKTSGSTKSFTEEARGEGSKDGDTSIKIGDSDLCTSTCKISDITLQQQDGASSEPKKRQKLHWGLDTKERWERKANM